MTHVVVDARMARDAGIGTYISQLLPRIIAARPHWDFTVLERDTPRFHAASISCASKIYTIGEQYELARRIPAGADLFWSPHYNIPLAHRGPLLVTVHDLAHLTLPEFTRSLPKTAYARLMFGAVRRNATGVICVSDFTRREYLRLLGAGRAKPVTVHNGVDDAWRGPPPPNPRVRPYIVYVGSVKAHKNLTTLLSAFEALVPTIPHDLVIVGRREGLVADQRALAQAERLGERVQVTGELPFPTVHAHVANADLLVMPSCYEGFGFPPLEAMAAGVPCVVSTAASLPEVCGAAAVYCDPGNPSDMASTIRRVIEDPRLQNDLREKGRAHAALFSWAESAEHTLNAMERAMGKATAS